MPRCRNQVRTGRVPVAEIVFWLVLAAGFWLWPSYLRAREPGADRRPVRAFLRSRPRIRRHRVPGPRGLLRCRCLRGRSAVQDTAGASLSPGLLLAAWCAGVTGFLTSFLVVRGKDLTRLMVTTGIGLLLFELANRLTDITGGNDGLIGMEMSPVLGAVPLRHVRKSRLRIQPGGHLRAVSPDAAPAQLAIRP